jgi:two-component response regulator (ARR-A family)
MAAAGEIFRSNLTELLEESHSGADELHVLAVDDNLVDRKVIERLLKISSCKGIIMILSIDNSMFFVNFFLFGIDSEKCFWNWNLSLFSVTVVESARRALQYLGLDEDGENSDIGFDVSKFCFWILNCV